MLGNLIIGVKTLLAFIAGGSSSEESLLEAWAKVLFDFFQVGSGLGGEGCGVVGFGLGFGFRRLA